MLPTAHLQSALSDQEIEELDTLLRERAIPKGGMEISMLDGYLTAIVSGPELVPPSEWLPGVWSAANENGSHEEPAFANLEEVQRVYGLVLRRMNEIIRTFRDGAIEPIFASRTNSEGEVSDLADFWCLGYMRGVFLRKTSWDPLIAEDENEGNPLSPIFALASPFFLPDSDDEADYDEHRAFIESKEHTEATALVPQAACTIYDYWLKRRRMPTLPVRRANRPGRNDACPCGSGKKYKKCCGSN
jgi:uncharacterized protein